MPKRHVYLKMKSLEEAQRIFFSAFDFSQYLKTETIPTTEALGRVTAEPIFARFSSPNFHCAAMDGYAVRAEVTFGATLNKPKELIIGKEAFAINTGYPLPEDTNAVIMIEDVVETDGKIEIKKAVYPWQHVRKVGEDIVATELILPPCHQITPYDMGALLEGGIFTIKVKEQPKVVIIPTGNEIVPIETLQERSLKKGEVVESNSWMLRALLDKAGAKCQKWSVVPDDYNQLKEAILTAVDSDAHLVIILAGSSAGSKDYTASALEKLGDVLVHGVTIMPGKPVILAKVKGKPVIGNPGYPVSSVISFEQFALPLLSRMQGIIYEDRPKVKTFLSRPVPSKLGIEEFLRVKLGQVGENIIATPLPRAAGSITTLTKAHGVIRIPAPKEGIGEDEAVEAELLVPKREILNTIVIIGSHDLTIDLLAAELKKINPFLSISSSNVGSLGGLMALKKGKAHLAGSHLFDPETGIYNLTYIDRYLKDVPVKVVNLVIRHQGLIIPKGNPKDIKGIEDLTRPDVTMVNRQRGAGTRILLDYKLKILGINPANIKGYDHEEFSHMAVAVDVLSGRADVGLGIYAAAKALGLDFIPIAIEEYDLVIPEKFWETEKIQTIYKLINTTHFKQAVEKMGGYDTNKTGTIKH
ncbi:MAG: molybdopterin biosynthesis protein [Candidatus Desulfofervidaceae bacterium]|nr:molybdopterin biosynthesis protein [Candidatus Desulfofervidaceae bacterium]